MAQPDPLLPFVRAWQAARAEGRDPPVRELCPDRPDLLRQLAERIDALRRTEGTLGPPDDEISLFRAPVPRKPTHPTRVGSYRLLEPLGKGGMGAVFRAEDERDGRQVAVKLILPDAVANPTARARFLREAGVQAEIQSEYVIPVFEVGESDGTPFLVLPLLRGETLEDLLMREPVPALRVTLKVAREVAEGLAAADARGVVHRDIKPSNIWLDGEPSSADPDARFRRCLLLDFGLARATGVPLHQLTTNRELLGTPAYMSPERVSGDPVDGRTDLFSLGAVLYEMATGRQPFDSPNPFTAMMNVMRLDPPPARSLNPAVPEVLSDLIARLLAKKPDDRPRTAREVADAVAAMPVPVEEARETVTFEPPVAPVPIEQFQETATFEPPVAGAEVVAVPRDGPKTPPLSVLRSTVRMPGVAAGVLLTAALVGVGIWAMSRGGTTRDEVPVIPPSPTPTVGGPIGLDPARIPPAERWPGAPAELVGVVGSGVRQHFGGVGMIVVHPEEKWVATLDAARPVRRVRFWDHATLTPAGSVEWDGDSLGQMAVSRDGRSLAVGVQYGPVALYDVSTPAAKLLGRLPAESVTRFAFLPDGSLLTAEPGGRMTVWDLATKQRRRNFTLPPLDFDRDASTRVQDLAVSADGSTLAVNCQNQVIRLWDLSREPPAELDVLHGPDQSWIGAALGADGKALYTAGFSVREPATTIRAWRVGGNGTQDAGMIARDDANSGYVEFALAPDGKQLAVSTLRSGVLRFDLSGRTPAAVPAIELRGEDVPAARLAFGRNANTLYTGGTALRAWDLTGTRPTERAPFDASSRVTASALTAESKLVAVHADGKLRVWDLTGPVPTVCRELATAVTAGQLAVTADGATAIQADGGLTVWPLDAPAPAPVRLGSAGAVADLALTPDGQYLLTSAARALTLWDRRGSDYSPRFNQQAAGGWGRCAVSPDGRWAAAVEFHAGLRLFRAADKELEPALDVPNPAAGAPVFSPDGSVLLVVGKDLARPLRYRLADQKWTAAPFPDRNDYSRIQDAVFGPDGRTIVACGSRVGSQDTRLEVWDADTGTVSRTVALPGRVTELSVSSDGRHVATQNDNGTAYILDLTPGPKD